MLTRNATTWIAVFGVMLIMLAFAATATAKPGGHVRPNDRGGIHGVGG
jgi:hypothetical protein